jgi:two-component system cell cycle response regulator
VNILVADDDPVSRRVLEATLSKWGYAVVSATDGDQAWSILQSEDAPRLAILDWVMPGMDGVEVCRALRDRTEAPYVYTILLTARDNKDDLVEGMGSGADDYIIKPFNAHELKVRLRAGRRILDLQQTLLETQEVLRVQATHDVLTSLANRGKVLETLQIELVRAFREGTLVGVIMADLDHFKDVNDTYGHIAGDGVLREAARRMKGSVRPYDLVGRYGGEEFLMVLPGCAEDGALNTAQRIRERISGEPFNTSEGLVPVTVSLGISVSDGSEDPEKVILAADAALYRAKKSGRNRVELGESIRAGIHQ